MGVILLGYRGCGKTSIGQKLADRLWLNLVDTDAWVVKTAGKSIAQIFADEGEAAFRQLETQAISRALEGVAKAGGEDAVISLGGGAILKEENRALLKASALKRVYLKCDAGELARRIAADPTSAAMRPSLTGKSPADEVAELLAVREPLYREVATGELDVTQLSIDEAATRVVRLM